MPPKKFVPNESHRTTLSRIADEHVTVALYGKVVDNLSIDSSSPALQHPSGDGPLHAGQIWGCYSPEKGCVRFSPPIQYMLPEPTGPADGCGWDPSRYVMWKVPSTWRTLYFRIQIGTVSESFIAGDSPVQTQLSAGQCLMIASDCVFDETGNPQEIDRSRTLQSYSIVSPEQISGVRGRIVNSSHGVQRFGFQISSNDLKDMSTSWTLGQLADRIQDAARQS